MTEPSSRPDPSTTRICLLVGDEANRRLLEGWLRDDRDAAVVSASDGSEGGVTRADEGGAIDLFVADEAGLRAHEPLVADRKAQAGEVFLPCLLASERGEAAVSAVDGTLVDDVVELPASKAALGRRLDRLLAERAQSLSIQEDRSTLREQNERLRMFAGRLAHDLRNPLGIVTGYLEEARSAPSEETFDVIEDALDRMGRLIDETLMLAKMGETAVDTTSLGLEAVARDAWSNVSTADATLTVEGDVVLAADESRLLELFENLFRNSAEHVGGDVAVRVGPFGEGFYVADDGPGIPEGDREQVFEVGYTTNEEGTGFGLRIVQEIAEAHGWSVALVESEDGGARFEVTGVELVDDGG